jgi:hypothetical protein
MLILLKEAVLAAGRHGKPVSLLDDTKPRVETMRIMARTRTRLRRVRRRRRSKRHPSTSLIPTVMHVVMK